MPTQQVTISINAHKTLLTDIYERRCIEACGLLTGSIDDLGNWHIDQAHPLRNIFDLPVYFEFAPEEILQLSSTTRGKLWELIIVIPQDWRLPVAQIARI